MKNQSIAFRKLTLRDLPQLHQSYLEAFADYPVNMSLDYTAFKQRMLIRLHLDFDLSVGAFHGQKLVGFLLHTENTYQKRASIYNGGTGVIPAYRGKSLVKLMYQYFQTQTSSHSAATQVVLEVLEKNEAARRSYQQSGFEAKRLLRCYRQTHFFTNSRVGLQISINHWHSNIDPDLFSRSSFMDTPGQLAHNHSALRVLTINHNDQTCGCLIGDVDRPRVCFLYVDPEFRQQGIGTALLHKMQLLAGVRKLSLLNVDEKIESLHKFLLAVGFENQFNQLEMVKQL